MNLDFIRIVDKGLGSLITLFLCLYIYPKKIFFTERGGRKIEKILIVRLFGFGNLVLAYPAIKKIRELFPKATITLLTVSQNRKLYDAVDIIDETYYINVKSLWGFLTSFVTVVRHFRGKKIDMALDFEVFAYVSAFIIYLCGIRKKVGFKIEGYMRGPLFDKSVLYNDNYHMSRNFYNIAIALGAEEKTNIPLEKLPSQPNSIKAVEQFLTDHQIVEGDFLVGMHVGTSENFINRRWPEKEWAKVANHLIDTYNAKLLFTTTPSERHLTDDTIREMKSDESNIVIADNFNLGHLAHLIKKCNLFFCADSGPLHLAIAMGAPTVSFFGPNTPRLYGPPKDGRHLYFYEHVSCSPCITNFNAKRSICDEPICLLEISAQKVIDSVDDFIKSQLPEFNPDGKPFKTIELA